MNRLKRPRTGFLALAALSLPALLCADPPKLKALLVTGGCCHDYPGQTKIITEAISKRVPVEWTIVQGETEREEKLDLYTKKDWAKGFDVVVHNECYGSVDDVEFVENIARAHFEGVAGVVIHCSMHSYRAAATDEWRKCLGVTSRSHEKHRPVEVKLLAPAHPIMKGFPATWRTPNGELYKIEKLWPEATPLAKAYGEDTKQDHVVAWTNTYGAGRIFGTTLGHHNETMREKVYLEMLIRGFLWACDKLDASGDPKEGYSGSK
jgi:type 1 glutamine amidotransferase